MSTPKSIQPSPQQVKKAYRAILRATSYLQDSFAREYIHGHVVKRFRVKSNTINDLKTDAEKRAQQALKKARSTTRTLEKANNGDLEALSKILMYAHGRKGARKRVLLRELLQKEESSLPKDDSALKELIAHARGSQALDYKPGDKFFEFLKSQQANQPAVVQKGVIKSLKPKIPEFNIWMRPMPRKREEGIRRRWWAETMDKILPPVPYTEWQRLAELATGILPLDDLPPRRAAPEQNPDEQWSSDPNDVLNCLANRPSDPDPKTEYIKMGLAGALQVNIDTSTKALKKGSEREVNTHALRRLYSTIWTMTPTMYQDEETKKWTVKWGKQKSAAHNGAVTVPSEAEKELFEGLEGVTIATPSVKLRKMKTSSVERTLKMLNRENAEAGTKNPLLR